jgi:MoaA/NifB/PqqE/SkfB family radical SAM enzyme
MPIIRHANGLGLWTTLITNGHLLTTDMVSELANLRTSLVLSLHSMKRTVYEQDNRSPGSFDVKMSSLALVSERFRNTEWRENGALVKRACIHWTLQANNLAEVSAAEQFCRDSGFHFSIAPLAATGHAESRPELWLPKDKSLESINELGDLSIIFWEEQDGRNVCGTCRYGLNIGCDGNLLLDAHGGYEVEIANIRDISFEKAVKLQHQFSQRMFSELSHFCPVRDSGWHEFLADRKYLRHASPP